MGHFEHRDDCWSPIECCRCRDLNEIDRLRGLLCRVINELGDPMGGYWCERPESDRRLLEALLDDLVEEMGLDT